VVFLMFFFCGMGLYSIIYHFIYTYYVPIYTIIYTYISLYIPLYIPIIIYIYYCRYISLYPLYIYIPYIPIIPSYIPYDVPILHILCPIKTLLKSWLLRWDIPEISTAGRTPWVRRFDTTTGRYIHIRTPVVSCK
jgi:hypothetical protein